MILKIKHRSSYYRRFQMDIWGLLRTTVFYKPAPVEPASDSWGRFYAKNPSRKLAELPVVHDHWFDDLRPTASQKQKAPWAYASRRLSRLLDFFYLAEERRRRAQRERWRRFIYQIAVEERYRRIPPLKHRFVTLRLVKLYYITYSYRQFRGLARLSRRRQGAFEENFLLALESRVAPFVYRLTLLGNPFHCLEFVRQGHVFVQGHCQNRPSSKVPLHQMVTFSGLGRRWLHHDLALRLVRRRVLFNVPSYVVVSFFFLYAYQRRPPRRKDLVFPVALDFYRATGYAF